MYVYKRTRTRMKPMNDMVLQMKRHEIHYAAITKLVDFSIDRAVEAYEKDPFGVEEEFRKYMSEANGQRSRR